MFYVCYRATLLKFLHFFKLHPLNLSFSLTLVALYCACYCEIQGEVRRGVWVSVNMEENN